MLRTFYYYKYYFTILNLKLQLSPYNKLVCCILYYCESDTEKFDEVIKFFNKNLKIQSDFGLIPFKSKNYESMSENEKEEFLKLRGKTSGLYGRNWLTNIEIDPPLLQRTFAKGENESSSPKEAMRLVVNKLKAKMIGERHYKKSCSVKKAKNGKLYGFMESQSTDDERKGDVTNVGNMSVDQSNLSVDTLSGS